MSGNRSKTFGAFGGNLKESPVYVAQKERNNDNLSPNLENESAQTAQLKKETTPVRRKSSTLQVAKRMEASKNILVKRPLSFKDLLEAVIIAEKPAEIRDACVALYANPKDDNREVNTVLEMFAEAASKIAESKKLLLRLNRYTHLLVDQELKDFYKELHQRIFESSAQEINVSEMNLDDDKKTRTVVQNILLRTELKELDDDVKEGVIILQKLREKLVHGQALLQQRLDMLKPMPSFGVGTDMGLVAERSILREAIGTQTSYAQSKKNARLAVSKENKNTFTHIIYEIDKALVEDTFSKKHFIDKCGAIEKATETLVNDKLLKRLPKSSFFKRIKEWAEDLITKFKFKPINTNSGIRVAADIICAVEPQPISDPSKIEAKMGLRR